MVLCNSSFSPNCLVSKTTYSSCSKMVEYDLEKVFLLFERESSFRDAQCVSSHQAPHGVLTQCPTLRSQ